MRTKTVIEVQKNLRGKWFWRLKSRMNGRTLAHSESYSRLQACEKTALRLASEFKISYYLCV